MARALVALAALAFLAVLARALLVGDSAAAIAFLVADPWGLTTLVDLYLGIAVFIAIVYRLEGSAARAWAWGVPALLLGHLVPAVYCLRVLGRIAPLTARR